MNQSIKITIIFSLLTFMFGILLPNNFVYAIDYNKTELLATNHIKTDPPKTSTDPPKTDTDKQTQTDTKQQSSTPTGYTGKDDSFPQINSPITGLSQDDKLPALIIRIIQYLLGVIALVAVIVITIAGFRMIIGSGNEEQRKKAKLSIIWAITGLILALLSFSIVTIIQAIIQP